MQNKEPESAASPLLTRCFSEGLIKEGIIPRPTVSGDVEEMSETEVRRKLAELLEKQKVRI